MHRSCVPVAVLDADNKYIIASTHLVIKRDALVLVLYSSHTHAVSEYLIGLLYLEHQLRPYHSNNFHIYIYLNENVIETSDQTIRCVYHYLIASYYQLLCGVNSVRLSLISMMCRSVINLY